MEELDLQGLLDCFNGFERGEQVILGYFGTVQSLLTLIIGRPIAVQLIDQRRVEAFTIRRVVNLMAGEIPLCTAVSEIAVNRNREDVIYDISAGSLGLGQIIMKHQIPTKRTLLDVHRDEITFSRQYEISGPDLYIKIQETFFRKPFVAMGWLKG